MYYFPKCRQQQSLIEQASELDRLMQEYNNSSSSNSYMQSKVTALNTTIAELREAVRFETDKYDQLGLKHHEALQQVRREGTQGPLEQFSVRKSFVYSAWTPTVGLL